MKVNSSQFKGGTPNQLIVYLAFILAKIYWIYSVLYYVLKETGLLHNKKETLITPSPSVIHHHHHKRRTKSDPTCSVTKHTTEAKEFIHRQRNANNTSYRRMSLPSHVHYRPSAQDERDGTTCPPVWWQKTRVKLRRHHRIPQSTDLNNPKQQNESLLLLSPSSSCSISSSDKPSLSVKAAEDVSSLSRCSSSSSSTSTATTNSESSDNSSHSSLYRHQKKSIKAFMTKLNTALHHHRRIRSFE
ncbi:uncharacterized protein BX663DRAFT_547184 [Cokeromyces recurvatus]|uniref:uncharacterized protein n=1 Tax=Cokeromyces recurvatus TaxID=90255 RepID=UPI00221EFBD6|nr:uncharacterized protein BX663DRAFT_547184 [Cokeromyces recurvatus]KAI7907455.1 hypothetical protein BX663DRAFT_547184 [Cokeromyces recurvatus]